MPSVGVNRGDHPILGDFAGDHEPAIGINLEVLADHRREQTGGPGDRPFEFPAVQHPQTPVPIGGERIDEFDPGVGALPITDRFPSSRVVVVTLKNSLQFGFQVRVDDFEEPTDR
jgi:hypothetical protein